MSPMITVTVDIDELNRERFRFHEYDWKVRLYYYTRETRKTKRHKWVAEAWWSHIDNRDSRTKYVIVPDSVVEQALAEYREKLAFQQMQSV